MSDPGIDGVLGVLIGLRRYLEGLGTQPGGGAATDADADADADMTAALNALRALTCEVEPRESGA